MELLRIEVTGTPHPQPRPAVTRNGHVYYPDRSKRYAAWREALGNAKLIDGGILPLPIKMHVTVEMLFIMPRPRSHYRAKNALSSTGQASPYPTTNGDIDNLAKAVLDACVSRGILADDGLVVSLLASKAWAWSREEQPGCLVIVRVPRDPVTARLDPIVLHP